MITNDDIKKLSSVFATKNDLDKKFEENLKPIHKKLNEMQKTLNMTIKYFDTVKTNHETRLKKVEKKIDSFPLLASTA